MVKYSRYGSSDRMLVGVRSKSRPSFAGVHIFLSVPNLVAPAAPRGISMQARRIPGLAASVLRNGVIAGNMASNIGNARVAPAPRRTVRREIFFFVMNIL